MDPSQEYATWLEIDREAIESNARKLVELSGGALMAVLKANGYGHGAVETARAALSGGASWLGVARPEEALELRAAGFEQPVLVMSAAPPGRLAQLVAADISLTVFEVRHLEQAAAASRSVAKPARLHLKLDTGMGRLGAAVEEGLALVRAIEADPQLELQGLFTHFARADEHGDQFTERQLETFQEAVAALEARDLRPPLVHAANSAAALTRAASHFDLIRCGIALFGMHPSGSTPLPEGFRPALSWKAQLSRVRTLPAGSGISYGHEYRTRGEERIGTIPVGYGDGLRRTNGNQSLVGGTPAPVVGRVCMDLCMLRLDPTVAAEPGDEVVLIGEQRGQRITAEQVAEHWGTVNYEVTCAISARVPRVYL